VTDDAEEADPQPDPPPVLCMECKRNVATIERGKARWCGMCIAWIERRKEFVDLAEGRRKRRKKDE
jgi:hypothetical protein